jgi:hypothetical protein
MGGLLYWFIGSENFQTGVQDTHTQRDARYLATWY